MLFGWITPAFAGAGPASMPCARSQRASQLDWLISITAINVPFSSRAASDLLMSLDCGMGHPVGCLQRR
jgi:hypothetical protein